MGSARIVERIYETGMYESTFGRPKKAWLDGVNQVLKNIHIRSQKNERRCNAECMNVFKAIGEGSVVDEELETNVAYTAYLGREGVKSVIIVVIAVLESRCFKLSCSDKMLTFSYE